MKISFFAFFLICYYIFIFITKSGKERFVLSLVMLLICSLTIQMGYFVMIGEKGVPYSTVAVIASSFMGLTCRYKCANNTKLTKISILFLLSIFFSVFLIKLYPYSKPIIADSNYSDFIEGKSGYSTLSSSDIKYGLIEVMIFLSIILCRIQRCLGVSDIVFIAKRFIRVVLFVVIIVGFGEFILENIFQSLLVTDVTIGIFGEYGAQQNALLERNGLYAIQATTKEASMYSVSLLYSAIICICLLKLVNNRTSLKHYTRLLVFFFLLLIINRSMASYVYCFILMLCLLYVNPYNWKLFRSSKIVPCFIMFLGGVILLIISSANFLTKFDDSDNYFLSRLSMSLNELTSISSGVFSYTSEGIRYLGILQCWQVFTDRPFWGVGLTELTCLSGFVTLLVSIGIVGTLLWILQMISFAKTKWRNSITIVLLVLIMPNILLNDIGTMFSLTMPFVFLLMTISCKNNSQ